MSIRNQRVIGSILLFVMLQVAWFGLLAIWIYWYVANYITFTEISERVYVQIDFNTQNVVALVGGIVLLVGVAGGITVLFGKLRRQLKVTRMYESFIANVTHELKSPLASIQIHLETLLTRSPPQKEARSFLELMRRDAERLDRHITSILQIAGLEEGKSSLQRSEHDADSLLRTLFSRAIEQFGVPAGNATIDGALDCVISVDDRAMEIIIDNLVDNAVKYSTASPNIGMKMWCTKKRLKVSISDNGIGIAQKDQKLVFRKFVRLENPSSPSVKGTGIGLYWVREIIRHYGGHISVSSEGVGEGSTFTFDIPLKPDGRSKSHLNKSVLRTESI